MLACLHRQAPSPASQPASQPASKQASRIPASKRVLNKLLTFAQLFRILGDLSHLSAKGILIFAIHRNRSAEGVSLITQALYALVFCTRYLDIFREKILWNFLFKIIYIVSSFYTIGLMQWVFPRSRERELAWKMGAGVLAVSAALSPFMMMIFEQHWRFRTVRIDVYSCA